MNRKDRRKSWRDKNQRINKKLYSAYLLYIPLNLRPRLNLAAKQAGQSLRGFILTALSNAIEYYEGRKE